MAGLIVTKQDLNISHITKFTKFCIFDHLYIETKCPKVQKSFEDIAEHLFNHCKCTFLTEVSQALVFLNICLIFFYLFHIILISKKF